MTGFRGPVKILGDSDDALTDTPTGALQAGSVAAPSGFTGPLIGKANMTAQVLAAAGSGQSTYAQITGQLVAVTGADGTVGVALPAAAANLSVYVLNTSAVAALPIAPVNGGNDQINSLTANTGVFTLAPGKGAWFIGTSATKWYVDPLAAAPTSASIGSVTFSVAAGAANICVITGTIKDVLGATLAERRNLRVYLTTDANGAGVTGTSYSTGAAVTGGTGLVTVTSNKVFDIQTASDGTFAISITATGKPATERLVAVLPSNGTPQVSAVSGTAYG